MKNTYILLILISTMLFLQSCFKEDDKIAPHQPGDVLTSTVEMGQYYANQSYFDLETNMNMGNNAKDIWDLAFACKDSSMMVKLNSAKFMRASNMMDTNFFSVNDTTNMTWSFDVASGNVDSIAIQDWYEIKNNDTLFTGYTYLIDRGINSLGVLQGIRKLKILSYSNDVYYIQYANLDNSGLKKVMIEKKDLCNYVQLNMDANGTQYTLEPQNDQWDLFFTQYTDMLSTSTGEQYPYLVTGVLFNPNMVIGAMTTDLNFDQIIIDDIVNVQFKKSANVIGYSWKYYDFDDGVYTVLPEKIYIVRDTDGYFYKLRFIAFYNEMGVKGYPKFEFQKL